MIWWCQEHRSGESAEEGTCEIAALHMHAWPLPILDDCRMVEALLIVKENGEWPKAAIEVLRYDVAALAEAGPRAILDALASVGGDSQ